MIELIETKSSNLLEIKVIEEASSVDINRLKPVLKKHATESESPRVLFIFSGLEEWGEVVQMWTKLNMKSTQVNQYTRIALVGKASWQGWLTKAVEKMVDTDLKFFGEPDMQKARTWVLQ